MKIATAAGGGGGGAGVVGEVSPPRDLEKGEVAQVPCVKINKAYFGVIWLTQTVGCFA